MKLNYKKIGSGRPLIILHGVFGSLDNWMTLGRKFGEDFEVYLVDQRNHGQSPHSDEFSYELMAADLREFIEEHQIREPVVTGHSMGGKTAMMFSLENPELLSRLIVVDMVPKAYEVHHQGLIDAMKSLDFDRIRSRKEADKALENDIPNFGVRQFLLKNLYWKEKDRLGWRFNLEVLDREIGNISGNIELKGEFEKPTLFIRGGKSGYVKDEDEQLIRSYFPEAEIQTVDKAGHWVHAEAPREFYDAITAFLGS